MNSKIQRLQRLQKISRLLDTQFEGPFGIRFGLDPLIGLIPILGDALTTLVSFYIVFEAYHLGCSSTVLFRMVLNIFLEDVIKVIPVLGQVFDFYWKSNTKNMELIEKFMGAPQKTTRNSALLLGVLLLIFLGMMTFVLAATVYLIVTIIQLL